MTRPKVRYTLPLMIGAFGFNAYQGYMRESPIDPYVLVCAAGTAVGVTIEMKVKEAERPSAIGVGTALGMSGAGYYCGIVARSIADLL